MTQAQVLSVMGRHYPAKNIHCIARPAGLYTAGSTLECPQRPSEVEREVEREAEVLLPVSLNDEKQEEVGQEEDHPAERLSKVLFKLLDQPRDQVNSLSTWFKQVNTLLKSSHAEEEIKSVMEFAVKDNDFSAEYLTLAKEPMASFVKNYDQLLKPNRINWQRSMSPITKGSHLIL